MPLWTSQCPQSVKGQRKEYIQYYKGQFEAGIWQILRCKGQQPFISVYKKKWQIDAWQELWKDLRFITTNIISVLITK